MLNIKNESIVDNPLMKRDFERMLKMSTVEQIKDYLYDTTMSQRYDEAKNTLSYYYAYSKEHKYNKIAEAIKYILVTSFHGGVK